MSPNEAADVLGVAPTATVDEVQRAYEAKIAEVGDDVQRRDAVTAARDALLAASAWQAPGAAHAPTAPVDASPQHSGYAPPPDSAAPQPPYGVGGPTAAPQAPYAAGGPAAAPQPPSATGGPTAAPPPSATGGPTAAPPPYAPGGPTAAPQSPYAADGPTVPPQPPYPAAPWYPAPPPARRGLSTGAIVGITLGSIAAALVILIVVFVAIFAVAHQSARLADPGLGSTAAPFDDPSDDPSQGGDAASAEDYDVDGVHVHNVDGWTFELTAGQSCTGAQITAGFSDSPDGDDLDQWSTVVDLEAGVPVTITIPDSASDYDYAGIETIDCSQA
ncbi:hypothetical protein ACRAWB_12730 [Leifsonia poae]|uniref:hypothetical protein n=1 Tax=Leifsonia poae TaxID=110933 RepID=UPI003D687AB9